MDPYVRLDAAIEARRLELDLNLNDVAAAARISPATLRAIRRGTTQPTALTKRRIEDALQWKHGSIDAIFGGGEPTSLAEDGLREATPGDRSREVAEEIAERLRLLEEDREKDRKRIDEMAEEIKRLRNRRPG